MAQTGPRDKATIESLKERMARDPLSRAFLQLAEEYRKAGRFEEAVQVCNEGLARHPGYHTARIALGRTYLDAGDLESAHQALTEVLDSMPENHLAGKLLAEVQLRLGNRAGAAETYRAILSHYPGDREVEGLLNELEHGEAAGTASPAPEPAGGPAPGIGSAACGEIGVAEPPPLEVVDGGEAAAAPPPADEKIAPVATPMDDVGAADRFAADQPAAAGSVPGGEPAPSSPDPTETPAMVAPAGADALQTNTLAELYLRQGLVEKALEVYRAMLRVDPDNERARRRLEELSGEGMRSGGNESEPPHEGPPSAGRSEQPARGESTSRDADVEIAPPRFPEPAALDRDERAIPTAAADHAGGDEGAMPASPEPSVSPVASEPLASPDPARSSGPVGSPHPVDAPPPVDLPQPIDSRDRKAAVEPVNAAAMATVERLERWLLTIRSGASPANGDARR